MKKSAQFLMCIFLSLLCATIVVLPTACAELYSDKHFHVLFLSSYSYEWESIPKQLDGITDVLNEYAQVDYVFMDTKRLAYDDVKDDVYAHIERHAQVSPYKYVIAGDDAALEFALEFREDLFSSTPIIFEGINDEAFAHSAAQDSLVTGIVETFPLKDTIEAAVALNKKATKVVAITDDTVSGRGSTAQFMNCKSSFPNMMFSTLNCSFLTADALGQALSAFGDDVVLIFLLMTSDADGNFYTNTQAVDFVSQYARVPVFKADELGLGQGIFGGVVVSYRAMAGQAAKIVLELENGAAVSSFSVIEAETYCVFDKKVMDKFGISKADVSSACGKNVSYVNDEQSFFEQCKTVLVPACVIFTLMIVFGVVMGLVLSNKRRLVVTLQDREDMLNSLLDNIPGGLAVYRVKGVDENSIETIYSSQGIPKLSGRTMAEYDEWIKGGLFFNTVYAADLSHLTDVLKENIPLKKPFSVRYRLKCKDGTTKPVSLSAEWGHDEKDGSAVYYAVYMDNTEQEKAHFAEREAIEAKASNEAKSMFLSTMSHDIRTPLNAVLNFTSLARDEENVPESVKDYLTKIDLSGKYLLGLVNDVLDMSKIESGKLQLHEESNNLFGVFNDLADIFRAQAEEKGIDLVTNFPADAEQWLVFDQVRMRQIYANLLGNAIKFSDKGSTILWTVRVLQTDDVARVVCSVKDHGCGMSKDFMEKMFQPFEQGQQSHSYNGTGLGLSIVKSLVSLMNGHVWAESALGKGTTFTIEMDRKIGEPRKVEAKTDEASNEVLNGRKVLLCEDNVLNVIVAEQLLQKVGCQIEVAENGKEGVKKFSSSKKNEFDAILMDIRMPEMDGLQATKVIRALAREDAKTIPIIAMSANAFDEDVKLSLASGMNAHVAKPVDPNALYSTLSKQIRKSIQSR